MKIQECIDILGKPINDEKVINFIEKYEYTYPKKDTISNKKEDSSYWVKNKKTKVNFVCNINVKNSLYKAIPSDRKGIYYPIVQSFSIVDGSLVEDVPFGINFTLSYDKLVEKLGESTVKSSEISQMWLREGKESFYHWYKTIDDQKQIDMWVMFSAIKNKVIETNFKLHFNEPLFSFYYPLRYETFETYANEKTNINIANMMFIRWLIENDYIAKTDNNSDILDNIKQQKLSVLEYIKTLSLGYFGRDELAKNTMSIRRYIKNLNEPKIYYYGEFKELFGIDRHNEKDNIVEYNEENYQKVKKLLDNKDFTK